MSSVKIKTEATTTTTTTAAAVDVQVKLEPSLSTTSDIKLEQHSSDIDTKVEFDSDIDSEDDYIKSENDDDIDQSQDTVAPSSQRQFICEYSGCGRSFTTAGHLRIHQNEHRLQTDVNILGKIYTLSRQSLGNRWTCPFPDCETTWKTINSLCGHIKRTHDRTKKYQQQQQQPPAQVTQRNLYFFDMDDFYVNGVRCGYHNTVGVFFCYECRLVPECLLTHLQQKHAFDEKSIDNSALPESAVSVNADPNINQHTSNPHLAASISQPYQQQHRDIVQGWLCVTSNCGYCGYIDSNKKYHKRTTHQGEQISIVPALVLRLVYAKTKGSYFLITRIDQASGAVTASSNRMSRHILDYSHNGLNAQDENEEDVDQNDTTHISSQIQQWKCEYPNCGHLFNSADQLRMHRREHKLEVVISVHGNAFNLSRQSLDDRWACPVPDCETTCKTILTTRGHILKNHSISIKHKRANSDDENNQQQQSIIKKRQYNFQYLMVDDFYVSGTKYGYHKPTELFICYECRLVPECLLTHLQQKHELDEKSIDNSILPESARTAGSDPNINQHSGNLYLASAVRVPSQMHHQDIVQGWLCITSECGYCGNTKKSKNNHHYLEHRGKPQSTVPAIVLRLLYGKAQTTCFLIARLDAITNSSKPDNSTSQYSSECDDDDDGDELVLSDYSDEDDIH